ncbi:MAG: HEPN domain-containing protein [Elusimicrobia bacterium]|jgi:uncharacterized protein (UPF0332 family)|nr:HEPN domain-containing protein [Elusimicrobiota bacterium]
MAKDLNKNLEQCFNKGGLRNIQADPKSIRRHLDKASSNLKAMDIMFDNQKYDWTIVCGYYAMYHAVLAALIKIGICATKHFCAISAFNKFYIYRKDADKKYIEYLNRAKELEEKYSETLEHAQTDRVSDQYGVQIITNDDAEWIIEEAKDFVLKIEEILAN